MAYSASIIICTKNRLSDVVRCLVSLSQQSYTSKELIIVDSSDMPLEKEEQFLEHFNASSFPHSELKYMHTTPGLTHQRNIGVKQATGDIVYFFDDDVVLEKEYLTSMQHVFNGRPGYAGGMGTITNLMPLSWRYRLFRSLFLLQRTYAHGSFTWSGMPTHPYGTHKFKDVELVGGCCMAFKRTVLQDYAFDENLKGYAFMEDSDIGRRISFSYPLFYNPAARLVHLESPTARDKRADVAALFTFNYSYLFFKHHYPTNRLKIFAYGWSLCGLFLECVLLRDWMRLRGYYQGLLRFYRERK